MIVEFNESIGGWDIVIVVCVEQPSASCIVTEYVPIGKLLAVDVVCVGDVFHEKLYGGNPPVKFIVADPLLFPKQLTLLIDGVGTPVNPT